MTRERSFSLRKQNRNRESKRGGVGPLLCQLYIPRCCHLEKTDDRPSRFLKDRGEGEEEGKDRSDTKERGSGKGRTEQSELSPSKKFKRVLFFLRSLAKFISGKNEIYR